MLLSYLSAEKGFNIVKQLKIIKIRSKKMIIFFISTIISLKIYMKQVHMSANKMSEEDFCRFHILEAILGQKMANFSKIAKK